MSDTARKSEETEKLSKAMKLLSLILLTLFCSSGFAQEGQNLELSHLDEIDKQVIPADTSVRTGVLKNGLTYYVRRCTVPEKKAAFWLLVKGGSVIEQYNERGLAHYVEHMMFRGTKHFPSTRKKGGDEAGGQGGVIGFMRRNGIPFGHDSNAFTGLNTVRYFLNGIPTEDTEQMDSCLLLLRDWAGDATITDEDVLEAHNPDAPVDKDHPQVGQKTKKSKSGIVVKGLYDVSVRFSKCCNPVPGDEIVGFVTRGRGVSIHRTDCINIINMPDSDKDRLIEAEWQPELLSSKDEENFLAEIHIYGHNRTGLLVDITKVFTEHEIDIRSIHSKTSKQGVATIDLSFLVKNREELSAICDRIKQIDSVIDIQRASGR